MEGNQLAGLLPFTPDPGGWADKQEHYMEIALFLAITAE